MMLFYVLIVAANTANISEKDIVTTFSKVKGVQERFLSDTIQHRGELEGFHENEFLPAVDSMISLLAKGQCQQCLIDYLRALTYRKDSADETISEQLSKIIESYPAQLNKACKRISDTDLEKIDAPMSHAIDMMKYTRGSKFSNTRTEKIPSCLTSKKVK